MPTDIQLHPGVSFCEVSGTFVFLDELKDKYYCLKGDQASWFEEIIRIRQPEKLNAKASAFLTHLIQEGTLIQTPGYVRDLAPCMHPNANRSLLDARTMGKPTLRDTVRLMATWLAVAGMRRTGAIRPMLEDVRRRKARLRAGQATGAATQLASAFHTLAPYFMTVHNACLFRSYFLIRYLASAGFPADWVFGVRLAPFSAHCWVEYQGCVLNEHLDTAREFQPILCT